MHFGGIVDLTSPVLRVLVPAGAFLELKNCTLGGLLTLQRYIAMGIRYRIISGSMVDMALELRNKKLFLRNVLVVHVSLVFV